MTVVVPYDSSPRSRAALRRADEFTDRTETVIAVTVIPNGNDRYARERGWLGEGESFDPEEVVRRLREEIREIDPDATFEYVVTGRYAQPGQIASKIREFAKDRDARLVVLGSENAGRIVSNVSSVASTVTADSAYDVLIVRQSE
ncbi:universal stress protein [Halovenus sp. WSH3]|uniref:Universal stress protein n=1 Tax=Halovenus carboxidivorans TaxID=2692199 RepID=A0A6B0SY73_9EURY|nr:universal stress protein [Halovenus carboxidivorans]